MENRVSITRQALLRQPMQLRKQERPRLLLRRRKHSLVQFVEQFPISGKKSAVQQRQVKLRIVFFDPLQLAVRGRSTVLQALTLSLFEAVLLESRMGRR